MRTHARTHYGLLLLVVWLAGCASGGVHLAPLSAPRAVVAYRTTGGELAVRHSADGAVWTEAMLVTDENGTKLRPAGAPTIVHDDGLYHLYWVTAAGELRYATSRAADVWAVQSTALTTVPPAGATAVSRGGGHHVALIRSSNPSTITAIDLAAPASRVQVAATSAAPASIAFGAGRFVAAVIGNDRRIRIVMSSDGRSWADLTTLGVARAFEATLQFSDGAFQLATQESGAATTTIPVAHCRRFTSPDGASWTESATPACGNSSTAVSAARLNGADFYLVNFDNRYLRTSVGGAALQDTHVLIPDGRPSLAVGPGPRLATLRLDRVFIEGEGGQDLSIATIGLKVRIGSAGSALATYSGQLVEFARDLDTGEQASIPPFVSPTSWFVKTTLAQELTQPGAQVDLVGAIVIGIERGNCPSGPIRGKLEEARSAIQTSLNTWLATSDLMTLQDASRRDALVGIVKCEVEKSVAGENPAACSGAPPVTTSGVLGALGDIVSGVLSSLGGFFVSLACGFNEDEQLAPADALGIASTFFPESAPPREVYTLAEGIAQRELDPLYLRSTDNSMVWKVNGHWSYLTE